MICRSPIAATTNQPRIFLPSIPDPYNSSSSDVQLPKISYPQNNYNDNNEPHTLVNSLSINDTDQHTNTTNSTHSKTTSPSIYNNNSSKNNIGSKRRYNDNDTSWSQKQPSALSSYHYIQNNINITDVRIFRKRKRKESVKARDDVTKKCGIN